MPPKNIKTEEIVVRQGKQNLNCYWLNMKAYQMLPNEDVVFAAGGEEDIEETALVKAFIKRNKKAYQKQIITAQIEYNELIPFGKYKNQTLENVRYSDLGYLKWILDKYTFKSGEEKLKQEITEILKTQPK